MGASSSSSPHSTSTAAYDHKKSRSGDIHTDSIPRWDLAEEINSQPVVVLTKRRCGYCDLAKTTLDKESIGYREIDLDSMREQNSDEHVRFLNELVTKTKQQSVPQIFICGKYIGGYDKLIEMRDMNRLHEAIAKCSGSRHKI